MKPKIQRSDSSSFGFRRERGFPGVQVCVHRGTKAVGELVGAAVSLSQETSDLGDRAKEDMDSDPGQATLSEAGDDSEVTEASVVGVAVVSAVGDGSESIGAREVDVVLPSAAPHVCGLMETLEGDVALPSAAPHVLGSIEEREVVAALPSAAGDVSQSTEAMEVDVAMPSTAIDVSVSTEPPEVDVVVPSAGIQVPESETAESDVAMPSAAADVPESTVTGESNVGLAGGDPVSELVDCVNHFCPTSKDFSDGGEAMGSKLKPELLKAAVHAAEAAGNEGLSVRQLARILVRTDREMTEEAVETYIDALETFDVVKQVNAYDHVRVFAGAHSTPFFIHVRAKNGQRSGADPDTCGKGTGGSSGLSTMATLTSIATGSRNWTRNTQPNLPTDNSHRRVTLSAGEDEDSEVSHTVPVLPWLTGDGSVNTTLLKSLTRRVLRVVMQNPGVLEEHLVDQLHVLNPQTARQFLQLLEYDGHVTVQ